MFYEHGKILWVCAWINLWVWTNFVGMKLWLMKKFCWVCDVGSWKIFVVMILAMWEFTSCAWTCRKLFVGYLGHVEVFVHGYGKKFGTCVWTWKILIVVKFLVGHFVVWSCWNLGHCMIDHVVMLALEHFWSVVFFLVMV